MGYNRLGFIEFAYTGVPLNRIKQSNASVNEYTNGKV